MWAERMVYCAQEPGILNATIKENVLFGSMYDPERYASAVFSAALEADLETFPAGAETEIGEKGLTLSGGQKTRVALARAAYAALGAQDPAGFVVLLDDPLSAVDASVASHIWNECICGDLAGTTRVLVTNQFHFLSHPELRQIVVMDGCQVVEQGTHAELMDVLESRYKRMADVTTTIATHKNAEVEPRSSTSGRLSTRRTAEPSRAVSRMTSTETKREGAVTLSTVVWFCCGSGLARTSFSLFCRHGLTTPWGRLSLTFTSPCGCLAETCLESRRTKNVSRSGWGWQHLAYCVSPVVGSCGQ